jgi:Leucine-rich repeat (LRR) protein
MTQAYNVPDTEIAALQDLYDATNGDFWNWRGTGSKWNFTNPNPCSDAWQGVNCSLVPTDGFVHVTELSLYAYGLTGSIPPTIYLLEQLGGLNLGENALSNAVPDSIGQLTQLTGLYLTSNMLTGKIPTVLGQLTQLTILDLDSNLFSGTIPEALQQLIQLTQLYLDTNKLTGSIPGSLGQLTQLAALDLANNLLSGTIPHALQKLTLLTRLFLEINHVTGTIPAALGQLTQLTVLGLDTNFLSGTIPDGLQKLTQLTELYLELNLLASTIPAFLGELVNLTVLDLNSNLLDGTIPDAFQQLTQLSQLYLNSNLLTGSLPDSLASLVQLRVLQLGTNRLTGRIPDSLSQMAMLDLLCLQVNRLTGTIPPSLGQLEWLRAVFMGRNKLRGFIPQNWTAAGNVIQVLHLHENRLSGPIPDSLGYLPQLQSLNLSSNHLSGTIPGSFRRLGSLQVLMLHNNQLGGAVTGVFSPSQANLSTVQLSNNQLTGSLPAVAFLLPSLTSFAAVDNCFDGPLPEKAICNSTCLRALVLDGLHSASSCKHSVFRSHKAIKLGSLPSCLLSMTNLATLHLSGSGLTGTFPTDANISAVLTDLSLSHNLLSGDVPKRLLVRDWDKLDLSYNRLTGTLHSSRAAPYGNGSHLYMQHNRLSGVIPGNVQRVGSLSVLENNMFSCRVDRSDVPQQDTDSDKYTCGSVTVNNALYAWLGAAAAIAVASGVTVYFRQSVQAVSNWFLAVRDAKHCKLQGLLGAAGTICAIGAGCTTYGTLVLLPVYAAINSYHPTFTHKYAWTVSGVFLTGTAAFALGAVFLLLQLPVCAYVAERLLAHRGTASQHCAAGEASSTAKLYKSSAYVASAVVMVISLTVVAGFNVGFVVATLNLNGRELTVVQILLAVFKLGFNNVAAPALLNRARALGVGQELSTSQLLLVLLNVIVIPCLVVMVISPACFYDALKGTAPVTSSYEYFGSCQLFDVAIAGATGDVLRVTCLELEAEVGATTYTPSFTYSYQCSSSFVTSYAPTFVIMCIISGFVLPAYHVVLLWLRRYLSPASRLYTMVTAATPRILRELPSPHDLTQARSDPLYRPVFDANKLMMSLLTYLALLLTFGALFPPLAVCCAVAMASLALTARLEVGRYVSAAMAADRQDCLDEVESACAGVATPQQLRMALYLVLAVSCMFYTLFLFDTLGYEVGFAGAFWVLIVVPLLPLVAWALHVVARRVRGNGTEANKPASTAGEPEVVVELAGMHTAKVNSGVVDTFCASPMHMP